MLNASQVLKLRLQHDKITLSNTWGKELPLESLKRIVYTKDNNLFTVLMVIIKPEFTEIIFTIGSYTSSEVRIQWSFKDTPFGIFPHTEYETFMKYGVFVPSDEAYLVIEDIDLEHIKIISPNIIGLPKRFNALFKVLFKDVIAETNESVKELRDLNPAPEKSLPTNIKFVYKHLLDNSEFLSEIIIRGILIVTSEGIVNPDKGKVHQIKKRFDFIKANDKTTFVIDYLFMTITPVENELKLISDPMNIDTAYGADAFLLFKDSNGVVHALVFGKMYEIHNFGDAGDGSVFKVTNAKENGDTPIIEGFVVGKEDIYYAYSGGGEWMHIIGSVQKSIALNKDISFNSLPSAQPYLAQPRYGFPIFVRDSFTRFGWYGIVDDFLAIKDYVSLSFNGSAPFTFSDVYIPYLVGFGINPYRRVAYSMHNFYLPESNTSLMTTGFYKSLSKVIESQPYSNRKIVKQILKLREEVVL